MKEILTDKNGEELDLVSGKLKNKATLNAAMTSSSSNSSESGEEVATTSKKKSKESTRQTGRRFSKSFRKLP